MPTDASARDDHAIISASSSIMISALQHFAFCPRQCALIHLEQQWQDNYLSAHGTQLHERVDSGEAETRKNTRFERSVKVYSERLKLSGTLDLLERRLSDQRLTPVEYKRGKPKITEIDKIQLCAQAMCLEDMESTEIKEGALWYWQNRQREIVVFDAELRQQTFNTILQVHQLFKDAKTPPAQFGKHCKACSLIDICQPKLTGKTKDPSSDHIRALYQLDNRQASNGPAN